MTRYHRLIHPREKKKHVVIATNYMSKYLDNIYVLLCKTLMPRKKLHVINFFKKFKKMTTCNL